MTEQGRGRARTREGVVVSDRPDKSAVVLVKRQIPHRRYGKSIVLSEKYMVHDERNEARVGDRVLICESRPISKRKRWRLRAILERAVADLPKPQELESEIAQ
jgi:small subunit ribosomal protein S17